MEIAQSAHFPSSDPKLLWVDTGRFVPPVRQALCHQCRMAPQRHFLLFCTASGVPSKQPSSLTSDSASQSSSFKAQPPLQARRFEWQYSEQVVFASISATTVQASLEHILSTFLMYLPSHTMFSSSTSSEMSPFAANIPLL